MTLLVCAIVIIVDAGGINVSTRADVEGQVAESTQDDSGSRFFKCWFRDGAVLVPIVVQDTNGGSQATTKPAPKHGT